MEQATTGTIHTLVSAAESGGALSLATQLLPPSSARYGLVQPGAGFLGCYVLGGTVALTSDEATVMLRAGEVFLLRPGRSLVYWNPCAAPAELLLIATPGHDDDTPRSGDDIAYRATPWDTS